MAIGARVGLPRPAGLVAGLAAGLVVAAIAAAVSPGPGRAGRGAADARPVRFATFNIELFPRDARQVEAAFDVIAGLGVSAVAVQEITDPELFARVADRRLGGWDFVHAETMPPGSRWTVHVGVAYDRAVWDLAGTAVHDQTRVDGRGKPTFEVRLRPRAGGSLVRLFVVHLKSGSDGRPFRARQLAALAELVRAEPGPIAVLGDFNATEPGDRDDLATLATETGLVWASRDLACTAYWRRADDDCPTSRLDHVLTWAPPERIEAAGACATHGCEWRDRCPLYIDRVSDHCPVVVTMP